MDEIVETSLKQAGLWGQVKDDLHKSAFTLSGGQQQRLCIARAIAVKPQILLMDEPFSAVDEITRKNLQDEIMRIQSETGITILFVTHDVEEALRLGTKVLILNNGSIEQFDISENILKNPASDFIKELIKYQK